MEIKKLNDYMWELPKQGSMNVPGLVFASERLMSKIQHDKTIEQIRNVACLKGIVKHSIAMPDAHQGYGFPIGGVAAFDLEEGIISPGGVGYDINCGVRLIKTPFNFSQVELRKKDLINDMFKNIPAGVGRAGKEKINKDVFAEITEKGAQWAVENGFGKKDDLDSMEEYGKISGSEFSKVSNEAVQRGVPQLGTLGSGNHFLEIQRIDKIIDEKAAKTFGIKKDQIVVMVHCGSRGFGHQIASDYIKLMEQKFGHEHLPDRELSCAPIQSEEGQRYFKAMHCAINFAFANRQMITHQVRESFKRVMGEEELDIIYDVCHNVAKIEEHVIDGQRRKVCVHRKGATRSFGPGRVEIPEKYRSLGQPVIIPGSMGTASYILLGTTKAEELSFGSTAHGAGREMSRTQALKDFRGEALVKELLAQGVDVKGTSMKGLAEEAPGCYKDIDEVALVSHEAGIGKMVARLVPIAVMKG
jgi:tRNA-splicing ligase RtcB